MSEKPIKATQKQREQSFVTKLYLLAYNFGQVIG